jgi:hypothetical protein
LFAFGPSRIAAEFGSTAAAIVHQEADEALRTRRVDGIQDSLLLTARFQQASSLKLCEMR